MMHYVSSSDDDDDIGLKSLDISNDQYYRKRLKLKIKRQQQGCDLQPDAISSTSQFTPPIYGSKAIRHSIAAYDLWKAFFPTFMNHEKFCNLHRPKLRHYNTGPQAKLAMIKRPRGFPIKNLTRHIFKRYRDLKSRVEKALRMDVARQDIIDNYLRIRHAKDLSAKSGEIFLFEYCEEYPPVLGQVGMASTIRNYVCPVSGSNIRANKSTQSKFVAPSCTRSQHTSNQPTRFSFDLIGHREEVVKEPPELYFCQMKTGSKSHFIENNLYRAPIFRHSIPSSDFLIVRTRNSFYVRSVKTIFLVGQTKPLVLIPSPTERQIMRFRSDLSSLYMHKLFAASDTEPPSVRLYDLERLFPDYPRAALQKRLKSRGAEGVRLNHEYLLAQGSSNLGLIPWTQRCKIITPEQYCTFMSSLAARERLRKLNYSDSMISQTSDISQIEPEILAAPWNTSKAVISAMKGQSFLDLKKHLIDPTGYQREGFSCVAWSRSPTEDQQAIEAKNNRLAPRKGMNAAPPVFGKNPLFHKIRMEKIERLSIFRKEAQLITETQSRVLSCADAMTSSEDDECDDEDDCENDSKFAEQLGDLDRLLVGATASELSYEKEEEERRKLLNDLMINNSRNTANKNYGRPAGAQTQSLTKDNLDVSNYRGRVLKITRTYEHNGARIERTELVREPQVIALYSKHKKSELASNGQGKAPDSPIGGGNDRLNNSCFTPNTCGDYLKPQQRSRSASLGPSELCRADGMKIRISKKVLDGMRPLRNCRRESDAH